MTRQRFSLAAWLHTLDLPKGREEVDRLVAKLAESHFDVLIACVKNTDGYFDYQTKVGDVRPVFAGRDPFRELTEMARKHGLRVHPWICTYNDGEFSRLRKKHPEVQAIQLPGYMSCTAPFLCTARPVVKQYVKDICFELIDNYDFEAIHFDYVRTAGQYCYCEVCRAKAIEIFGKDFFNIALSRLPESGTWYEWRCANITEVVAAVSKHAHAAGKSVSAAVFPNYPSTIVEQGQDWVDWLKKGHLDWAYPMNYHVMDRVVADQTRCHLAVAPDPSRVWEGLYVSQLYSVEKVERQVRSAAECGAGGAVIFEARYLTDEMFRRLKGVKDELSR